MDAFAKSTALETMDVGLTHSDQGASQKGGTIFDDNEMHRMGKIQEFKVSLLSDRRHNPQPITYNFN